jgi:Zn-dependent membrane protease YugP
MLDEEELAGARKVLFAAALTYVAAALATFLQLLRLVLLFGGNRNRN